MNAASAHDVVRAFEGSAATHSSDYKIISKIVPGLDERAHLARSREGCPALLIPIRQVKSETTQLTRALALRAVAQLEFALADSTWRAPAAIIECRDANLLPTFAALVTAFVTRLPKEGATWEAVATLFAEWESLLARRALLAGEAELGLWGELWCLTRSDRPAVLLEGWRGPDAAHVDFLIDGQGFEVKTSRQPRVHHLSQLQVQQPLSDLPVALVSLFVMQDPLKGRSLSELVRQLSSATTDLGSFEEKLAATGYSRADEAAYTRRFAVIERPLLFDMRSVPRVRAADPGVSHLRYRVELPLETALATVASSQIFGKLGIQPATYEYPCA